MTRWEPGELQEALKAVVSMSSKSEAALNSMAQKGGRAAQITLLQRRIRALRLCEGLIARELEQADKQS